MPYIQYPKPKPTLARADAERLLVRVIERAKEINADPVNFPYAVKRLHVFGSFLGDKDPLGDLDLIPELVLVRDSSELVGLRRGWRHIHWADKTHRALQVRKPRVVSIHMLGEIVSYGCPIRLVFEDAAVPEPPIPRRPRRAPNMP